MSENACKCLGTGTMLEVSPAEGGHILAIPKVCTGVDGPCPNAKARAYKAKVEAVGKHLGGMSARDRASEGAQKLDQAHQHRSRLLDTVRAHGSISLHPNDEVMLRCQLRTVRSHARSIGAPVEVSLSYVLEECHAAEDGVLTEDAVERILGLQPKTQETPERELEGLWENDVS